MGTPLRDGDGRVLALRGGLATNFNRSLALNTHLFNYRVSPKKDFFEIFRNNRWNHRTF